jgi:hypothetical protein
MSFSCVSVVRGRRTRIDASRRWAACGDRTGQRCGAHQPHLLGFLLGFLAGAGRDVLRFAYNR